MTLDELDKLAAEKVMGWEINEHPKNAYPAYWGRDTSARWITDWQPTRNISQAFECLEKFDAYQLFTRMRGVSPRHEAVVFTSDQLTSERVYFAESDSLPEAIVLACLRAVGVNDTPVGGRGGLLRYERT